MRFRGVEASSNAKFQNLCYRTPSIIYNLHAKKVARNNKQQVGQFADKAVEDVQGGVADKVDGGTGEAIGGGGVGVWDWARSTTWMD